MYNNSKDNAFWYFLGMALTCGGSSFWRGDGTGATSGRYLYTGINYLNSRSGDEVVSDEPSLLSD